MYFISLLERKCYGKMVHVKRDNSSLWLPRGSLMSPLSKICVSLVFLCALGEEAVCSNEELLFLHIPYNFGYTVGVAALYGHAVTSKWSVEEAWDHSGKSRA